IGPAGTRRAGTVLAGACSVLRAGRCAILRPAILRGTLRIGARGIPVARTGGARARAFTAPGEIAATIADLASRRLRTLLRFTIGARRRLHATTVHRLARLLARACTRRICVTAHPIARFRPGQAIAVLLAAVAVAIRHAVAIGAVVLPRAAVGADLAIGVDAVVVRGVDVDVVAAPVHVAPERAGDRHARAPGESTHQGAARVIACRWRVIRRRV